MNYIPVRSGVRPGIRGANSSSSDIQQMKIFRHEKWKTSTGMSDESSMNELFISDLRVTEYTSKIQPNRLPVPQIIILCLYILRLKELNSL